MKSENPNTKLISEINHRLALAIQTRGGLGKSMEAICKGNWLDQHGVPWKGYDLDAVSYTHLIFHHKEKRDMALLYF